MNQETINVIMESGNNGLAMPVLAIYMDSLDGINQGTLEVL